VASLVAILIEAVFMLNVNGIGLQLGDFVRDGPPPVPSRHVDKGKNPFAGTVRMTDD
jgi:hypothetical protein